MDSFYEQHLYDDFGEIAEAVQKELDEYSSLRKKNQNIESIEDMQKVLESMPELKRKSANVTKHVTLLGEISKLIEARVLTEVSRVEQEITAKDNKGEHLRSVLEILGKNFDKFDKLKLAIIFCIRYEAETAAINTIKKKLLEEGIPMVRKRSQEIRNYRKWLILLTMS